MSTNGKSNGKSNGASIGVGVEHRPAAHTFACQSCGAPAPKPKWAGRCAGCGAWDTIIEEGLRASESRFSSRRGRGERSGDENDDEDDDDDNDEEDGPPRQRQTSTSSCNVVEVEVPRISTGIDELDRVLGGGLVPGGIVLLSGDAGAGKSTLLLQAMASLANKGERALYASGEENLAQTASRVKRLKINEKNLFLMSTAELDDIFEEIEEKEPSVIVIDSIQTVRASNIESSAGTVSQLREVTGQIVSFCKERGIAAFLVGHVNKEGNVAGPKLIEHLVDTVLAFEGEKNHSLRVLRVDKNRAGSESEIGIFEMTADGMMEVPSPSAKLLAERAKKAEGNVIVCSCEGSRSMLVEVQALISNIGNGKRTVNGPDATRLGMIVAILRPYLIPGSADIFMSLAGGVRVSEPGIDLGIAIAIASSILQGVVPEDIAVFGEVGLTQEVRSVPRAEARINEAAAMGFKRIIVPASVTVRAPRGVKLHKVEKVREAIAIALSCKVEEVRYTKEALKAAAKRKH